ncbi:MAG: flagellar basal body rod protein FlgC [Sphingopyxis sp.]|jgi:flagellar basal-body rod protein FlgC|nr:flagellar basal body rod protein FlgC [Sphingopyxis sp.]
MMMSMNVFEISGRAMSAQLVRLNTVASNLANAGTVAGSEGGAYRSLRPVFRTVEDRPGVATVVVDRIDNSTVAPARRHDPSHPMADANGYVWDAAVDTSAELIDMVEAARQYQDNVQVLQTAKTLTLDTLRIGQ